VSSLGLFLAAYSPCNGSKAKRRREEPGRNAVENPRRHLLKSQNRILWSFIYPEVKSRLCYVL
jgi:hypothetical protein